MTQVILITGASTGIGRAAADLLAQRGHTVFGTSRRPEQYPAPGFSLLPLDVRDDRSVRDCVAQVMQQAGRIDVLVNNAGYGLSGALEEATLDDAKALFETQFFGVLRMTNAVLPLMRAQRSGQIINISSLAGIMGVPYLGMYSAAKHALEGYTEALRHEIKQFGIHVAIVEPGDINTPLVMQSPGQKIADYDSIRDRVNGIHDANVRGGPSPEIVARKVAAIIERQPGRFRHPVGKETWSVLAKRFLPDGLLERLMRLYYQMDETKMPQN